MKIFKGFVLFTVIALASACWAQSLMPKSEIEGGYTYGSLDNSGSRSNANGYHMGATTFLKPWLGIEANFTGLSHSESATVVSGGVTSTGSASEKHYTFVAGPQFKFGQGRTNPYVHVLFGMDRMSVDSSASIGGTTVSANTSDTGFATALGGGLKFPISKNFAIGTGFDYLMNRHAGTTLNDVRLQFGVIYQFGFGSGSKH